ncbi:MAG: hypothetical protein M5T52_08875 [Ignavibacteriaceae bacterium]|jgi:hypothetical protein|nr:hypothetical protein [Ignavibacteriaceae bacterium]
MNNTFKEIRSSEKSGKLVMMVIFLIIDFATMMIVLGIVSSF